MSKVMTIAHGNSALLALAREAGLQDLAARMRVQTCNLSAEEIAERDQTVSRQERRKLEREAKKRSRQVIMTGGKDHD